MENKENNRIIIFKNDDDDGKRHFTWSDYCHFVYCFKYWIFGVTLVFAIIGYLLVSLWWNPSKEVSIAHVEVEMPLSINKNADGVTTSIYFLDGSSRYSMYDIISPENIKYVVENTKDAEGNLVFSSVNVEKLIQTNGITISLETTTQYEGTNSYEVLVDSGDLRYVISCNNQYIGDSQEAADFVEALIQNIITKAVSLIPSQYLDSLISDFYSSLDLDVLLSQISTQYNTISSLYQNLMTRFQETDTVTLTKEIGSSETTTTTLRDVYNTFLQNYLATSGSETKFQYLSSVLSLNHYVRYNEGEEEIAIQNCMNQGDILIDRLDDTTRNIRQLTDSIARLNSIISSGSVSSSIQEQYATFNQRLNDAIASEEQILEDLSDLGYQYQLAEGSSYDYIVTLPSYSQIDPSEYGTIQHLKNPNDDSWKKSCASFIQEVDALVPQINFSLDQANEVYKGLYSSEETGIIWQDASRVVTTGGISPVLGAGAGLVLGFILSSIILSAYGYIKEKKGIPVLADGENAIASSNSVAPVDTTTSSENKEEQKNSPMENEQPSEENCSNEGSSSESSDSPSNDIK